MKSFQLSVDFLFLRARRWHLPLVLLLLTMPQLLGIAASVPGCASFFRGVWERLCHNHGNVQRVQELQIPAGTKGRAVT